MYNSSARGTGQFVRSIKLAGIATELYKDAEVRILAGNGILPKDLPARTTLVALPEISKSTDGAYVSKGSDVDSAFARRQRLISEVVSEFEPNIFLVDSRPLGLRDELRDTLLTLRTSKCRSALLLRDIIDDPVIVRKQWFDADWNQAVAALYLDVLVFGERQIFDAGSAYDFSAFAERVHHIGFLGSCNYSEGDSEIVRRDAGAGNNILVTVGGGYDGDQIIRAVCEFIQIQPKRFENIDYFLVLGLNSSLAAAELSNEYSWLPGKVRVYQHLKDVESLMIAADVVITMGGYNSITELMYLRKKIIAVPRLHSGREQLMRVELLASIYDGIWVAKMPQFSFQSLPSLLDCALASPAPSISIPFKARENFGGFLERCQ